MPLPERDQNPGAAGRHEEALARLSEELRQGSEAGDRTRPADIAALARRHGVSEEEARRCVAALEHLGLAARAPGTEGRNL